MKKISYRPVYNRKNRLNKQGKALLQIEAYLEKRKVYFSSHIHLTPQQWDKRRERIVAHPNAEALNLMLATFMMELEQKELELWKNGQDITLEKLKETFIKENMHTFLEFAKREIEDSQLKESTRKNRLTTCYLLAKFKQRINFKDLTSKFIFEFESFLYQQGCHTNTVAKHMKHLKLLVNSAINKGYIEPGNYAFRRYRIKTEEGKHAFLRPEELEKLESLDTSLLTTVQRLLGHRNLSTTQGYSEIMEGTIIKDLRRASK